MDNLKPFYIYCNWICNLASWINNFKVDGIEFIPFFVILRKGSSPQLKNHETIHFKQQVECLFVFWYLIYISQYLFNLIKMKHYDAYKNICFEKEAYKNQQNFNYIKTRKIFNWAR